ncbi:MAG: FAD-dependent oxidoreductase [Victivallaceae bacterium]|nr:FAD-dependent oxidoreductase [Victivallaceae bacterium]
MKHYEVAVIGGGIAGVAAAVQAARLGRKTVLIEKTALFGGLATAGLINVFLPLCDGNGRQVSFGLCEEMVRKSIEYGPGEIPPGWRDQRNASERKRFISVFSPASFVLSLDRMLEEAGVDLWLDTLVCAVHAEQGKIVDVSVENESGRLRVEADQFIDASGSAVLACRLAIPCFVEENYLSIWALEFLRGQIEMFYGAVYGDGKPTGKVSEEALARVGLSLEKLAEPLHPGISGKLVSEYLLNTRRYLRGYYQHAYATQESSRHTHYPVKLPIMPQFRKICAVKGSYIMTDGGYGKTAADSIGLVADWRKPGYVWEVPFAALYPEKGPDNLLFAGRCISAIGDAWEVMRVIPSAAVTGQACGLAAALAIRNRTEIRRLDVAAVQKELRGMHIPIHLDEVGL